MGLNVMTSGTMVVKIQWEYEDMLRISPTDGMFKASIVDGVRLYPYIYSGGECNLFRKIIVKEE